jgi:type VI protein secretion system component Hcp
MLKESLAVAIFAFGAHVAAAQPKLIIVPKPETRCVSTTMTSAFFLKIDEIRGDSLDKCHHDEIELMAFQNSGNAITVTKKIDISSPRMYLLALEGRAIPEAILTVLESGSQRRIMRYTMKNAVVSSIDQVAGSDNRETVQLRFSKLITETETSTATAGSSSSRPITVSFALGQSQSAASALNSGASAGRIQEFVLVKPLDASSPKLMQAKQSGQLIPEIVITLRPGSDSLTYKLTDVQIVSDVQQGSGSGQSETVHLKPSKVMLEYNSGSRQGASVRAGWDVKAQKRV